MNGGERTDERASARARAAKSTICAAPPFVVVHRPPESESRVTFNVGQLVRAGPRPSRRRWSGLSCGSIFSDLVRDYAFSRRTAPKGPPLHRRQLLDSLEANVVSRAIATTVSAGGSMRASDCVCRCICCCVGSLSECKTRKCTCASVCVSRCE
jgi:hypothetical protein